MEGAKPAASGGLPLVVGEKHLYDLPNARQTNSEIVVDKNVAEAGNSSPIDLGPSGLQRIGEPLGGLGQRLEVSQDGVLGLAIRKKRLSSFGDVLFDPLQTLADME